MNEGHEYKLIEGTFSAAEAQRLLGVLLKSKIDFHTLERHSEGERSGEDSRDVNRLKELRALDLQLRRLFEEGIASGKKFKIAGKLEIIPVD